MKQWIRFWGLGVFIAIALLWILCIDWLVKASIETLGSQLNGAKVELNAATINLWPTQIHLDGLQVANPDFPMSNTLEIAALSTEVDGLMLLRRQVIINTANIDGLKFNSPRQSSGALAGSEKDTSETDTSMFDLAGIDISDSIPGVSLPDPDSLIDGAKQRIQQQLTDIENNLDTIKQRWEKNIEQLPDQDKLDEYSARWEGLEDANFITKIAGLNSLKDDIKQDQELIKNLRKQLKTDQETIKQQLQAAQSLPASETDRLLSEVGLSTDSSGFMQAIMGGQAKQWLQQGMGIFNKLSARMSSSTTTEPTPERGTGQWIAFEEESPLPQFLLKQANISGELTLSNNITQFSGTTSDFAFPPTDWHKPATLQLASNDNQQTSFNASASLDHREPQFNDQLTIDINNLTLNSTPLADSDSMNMDLQKANASFNGTIELSNETVDIQVNALFDQVKLAIENKSDSSSQKIISDILSDIDNFDAEITVSGSVQQPSFRLKSNLDKALSSGLKTQLVEQTEALKASVQDKLEEQVSTELAQLQGKSSFLGEMDALMGDQSELLQDMIKL